MKKKALVLLSAGLDSSVNLYEAHQNLDVVLALTFDYGQKAAKKEILSAKNLAADLKIPHKVVDLSFFADFNKSALLVAHQQIPTGTQVDIHSLKTSQETAKSVWVPNRNGIFLNIAAGFAEALDADFVIPGFNAEEATTFPDNTEEFMSALDGSFKFSTSNQVKVKCFTSSLNKTQIVKRGLELQLPLEKIWPCYFAGATWCGQCESCLRSKNAMKSAGANYEDLFQS